MDKKNCLGLNKEYKADIEVGDYENLYVGLEIEFNLMKEFKRINRIPSITNPEGEEREVVERNRDGGEKMDDIAKHFGVNRGKTNGLGEKKTKLALANGGSIDVPVKINLYEDNKFVTQVYGDGSVDYEVVTRPVNLKLLKYIKTDVFDYLKGMEGVDFDCSGRSGLHMTFVLDHHRERSRWDRAVIQNLMQYARCYYEELIQLGRCNRYTRSLEYRRLFKLIDMEDCSNSHHNAITTRKNEDGSIWGIEVRFPDGTDNWEKIMRVIKFWMAMIRHCAIISKYGRITFDQEIWNKQLAFYESCTGRNNIVGKKMERSAQLVKQIKDSLSYYGIDVKDGLICNKVISKEDKIVEIIWEYILEGKNYKCVCDLLKEKGYDQKQIYAGCKEVGLK